MHERRLCYCCSNNHNAWTFIIMDNILYNTYIYQKMSNACIQSSNHSTCEHVNTWSLTVPIIPLFTFKIHTQNFQMLHQQYGYSRSTLRLFYPMIKPFPFFWNNIVNKNDIYMETDTLASSIFENPLNNPLGILYQSNPYTLYSAINWLITKIYIHHQQILNNHYNKTQTIVMSHSCTSSDYLYTPDLLSSYPCIWHWCRHWQE